MAHPGIQVTLTTCMAASSPASCISSITVPQSVLAHWNVGGPTECWPYVLPSYPPPLLARCMGSAGDTIMSQLSQSGWPLASLRGGPRVGNRVGEERGAERNAASAGGMTREPEARGQRADCGVTGKRPETCRLRMWYLSWPMLSCGKVGPRFMRHLSIFPSPPHAPRRRQCMHWKRQEAGAPGGRLDGGMEE
jgi:hypothetical protein